MSEPIRPSKKASATKSFGLLILSLSLLMGVRWALFEPYVIPSGSMIPTLLIHDHIVVSKYSYGLRWPFSSKWINTPSTPTRGDVVVFRSVDDPSYFMIKRVVGLPGDRIEIKDDGKLLVNGSPVPVTSVAKEDHWALHELQADGRSVELRREELGEAQYLTAHQQTSYRHFKLPTPVQEGHIFLLGDNRDRSRDSRYWGELPIENLIGKAQYVWLSCSQAIVAEGFICDPRTIRWSRIFHKIQ